jgi:hypothetical protein
VDDFLRLGVVGGNEKEKKNDSDDDEDLPMRPCRHFFVSPM